MYLYLPNIDQCPCLPHHFIRSINLPFCVPAKRHICMPHVTTPSARRPPAAARHISSLPRDGIVNMWYCSLSATGSYGHSTRTC